MIKRDGFKCVICGKWSVGWGNKKQYGNNPAPVKNKGECCDYCNATVIIPVRLGQLKECRAWGMAEVAE
jgi:hypothetical protein